MAEELEWPQCIIRKMYFRKNKWQRYWDPYHSRNDRMLFRDPFMWVCLPFFFFKHNTIFKLKKICYKRTMKDFLKLYNWLKCKVSFE